MKDVIKALKKRFDDKSLDAIFILGIEKDQMYDLLKYQSSAQLLILYLHINFAKMRIEQLLFDSAYGDKQKTKESE